MNAKEAINILAKMQNYDSKRNVEALEIAISALEKVPVLEAENARLREKETPKEHNQPRWNIDRWTINCPGCDGEIDDDSDFCKWCGQAIKNDKE